MLRAVIFDMDGVLIDTEPIWRRVEIATFNGLGLSLTEADSIQTMGVRLPEVVAHWFSVHPWQGPSVAQVTETILERMVATVTAEGEPMTGVHDALAVAWGTGMRTAIASSSSRRLIEAVVRRLGIGERIETICSADDDGIGKPHPAIYRRTAAALKLHPSECLAIEDSPHGITSALAAGMVCIAIPDPMAMADPAVARAHHRLGSLLELTPALLQQLGDAERERPAG